MQFNILFLTDNDLSVLDFMVYSLQESLPGISISTFGAKYESEAMAILESEKISLIIADMNIDTIESYEFYDDLQLDDYYKDIPFVFLSSNEEDQEIAFLKGISNFFLKPLNIDDLLDTLRDILKKTALVHSDSNLYLNMIYNNVEKIDRLLDENKDNKEKIRQITDNIKLQIKQLASS